MSTIKNWSTSPGSNNSAAPNGAPEGMAPSAVNNTMRQNMAELAKWFKDTNGSITSAGSATAYTLTTSQSESAYARGQVYLFSAHVGNTGAATLNCDALGAKAIQKQDGSALSAGDLPINGQVMVVYDGTQFQLLTADTVHTAAQVKALYEANSDTNEFSDAEQTKLSGIETSATADQTNAEVKTAYEANADTNEFSDAEQTKLGAATYINTASKIVQRSSTGLINVDRITCPGANGVPITVGANGEGHSEIQFFDDASDAYRSLKWVSTAFQIEDNDGAFAAISTSDTVYTHPNHT
ncbi:MAG TPA: hypothetical protein EYQ44_02465, partial [Porticoccaceae bacterium]|nr:hypothetical protein [Porticoccaceae bacterium]